MNHNQNYKTKVVIKLKKEEKKYWFSGWLFFK